MRTYLTALAFIVFLCSCSQGNDPIDPNPDPVSPKVDTLNGWQRYFAGDSMTISDITFVSPSKGFLCMPNKGMYKSVDSGKTWQLMPLPNGAANVVTINFLNAQYGYCIGPSNMSFGFTSNGGDSWTFKSSPKGADVWFTSPSTGYVVGYMGLHKTVDTGTTWQALNGPDGIGIQFVNSQVGWITSLSSPDKIYKTENAGNTWTLKFADNNNNGPFHTVFFTDLNNGWAMANNTMVKTTDGGNSWQTFALETYHGFDIQFLNNQLGYRTEGGKISKSIDGGNTWTKDLILHSTGLVELFFLDPNHGWAAGSNGAVFRWKN